MGGALQLLSPSVLADGLFTFGAQDAFGGSLTQDDLGLFEVQASTNLMDWETLPIALNLTNGMLLLQDPSSTNYPARFYRIVEH